MKNLISVIIPTYNVEKFIEDAIQSVLDQSYSNLEIIIVDDASTDSTYSILKMLEKKDKRIKLFKNDVNYKIAETLNIALSKSKGEFIVRMDGDDISLPSRLETLLKFLENNPQIGLVGSQTETINESGDIIGSPSSPILEKNIIKGLKYRMSTVLHIWMARKEVYEKLREYRIPYAEDYDFLLRLVSHNVRFTNVSDILYQVRIREGNTASSNGLKQRLAVEYAYELYLERSINATKLDSYSDVILEKKMSRIRLLEITHHNSNLLLHAAMKIKAKGIGVRFFIYIIGSLVLSPVYQSQFLLNRYRVKKLK